MRKIITLLCLLAITTKALAQHKITFKTIDATTLQPITGASIMYNKTVGASTNTAGFTSFKNLAVGEYIFSFSHINYTLVQQKVSIPSIVDTIIITLNVDRTQTENDVVVTATRTNRSLSNTPTRVEIMEHEVEEAAIMDPSKVSHLLTHSTGIQLQNTSATSNTANIRIQGLDGRYTQILQNGFPLYGGYAGSLSIIQVPPLDLKQVEYIKGSTSTLYGAGAIAGIINLVSKEPTVNNEETSLHIQQSSLMQSNINAYISRKVNDKLGFALLATRNTQQAFDANKDGFSDLAQLTKYNFQPRIYYQFNSKTKAYVGATFTDENRYGGDMQLIKNQPLSPAHFYSEQNQTTRITTQAELSHQITESNKIILRNSISFFKRSIFLQADASLQRTSFDGKQLSTFSEISLQHQHNKHNLVAGINFYTDQFKENLVQNIRARNENNQTIGAFVQSTYNITNQFIVEGGIRVDGVLNSAIAKDYDQLFILPRLSLLYKISRQWSMRLGGGLGYKLPSIFGQEAEIIAFNGVQNIKENTVQAETSKGVNADINWRKSLGSGWNMNVNQLFFLTYINKPLAFTPQGMQQAYTNTNGYTKTQGFETSVRFTKGPWTLYGGYTYTDANHYNNNVKTIVPLVVKHSLKVDFMYEVHDKWRFGIDGEYYGTQILSNGVATKSYFIPGILAMRYFGNMGIYINVENITDQRQSRFQPMLSGPYNTPQFTEVWAPLEGRYIQLGLMINFGKKQAHDEHQHQHNTEATTMDMKEDVVYACPMHPEVKGKKGDKCYKCGGMGLQPATSHTSTEKYTMHLNTNQSFYADSVSTLVFTPKNVNDADAKVDLQIVHEKPLHVIIASKDLSYYAHEHPIIQANGSYGLQYSFPAGGEYVVFADYTPVHAANNVQRYSIQVKGDIPESKNFTTQQLTAQTDGYTVTLQAEEPHLEVGKTQAFKAIITKNGIVEKNLENIMGAKAHLVILSADTKQYIHVHPEETNNPIQSFHGYFEHGGLYRGFLQFQTDGKVHTAAFTLYVQ